MPRHGQGTPQHCGTNSTLGTKELKTEVCGGRWQKCEFVRISSVGGGTHTPSGDTLRGLVSCRQDLIPLAL